MLRRLLIGLDAAASAAGWAIGLRLTNGLELPARAPGGAVIVVAILTLVTTIMIGMQRLYLSRVSRHPGRGDRPALAGHRARRRRRPPAAAGPRDRRVDPGTLAGALAAFTLLITTRGMYRHWLSVGRRDGRFLRSVVVVGTNEEAFDLCKLIGDHPELGFRVAGVVGDDGSLEHLVPRLGDLDDIVGVVERSGANGVVIAASSVKPNQLNVVMREMLRRGIHVHLSSGVRGVAHHRLRAQPMAHEPLFYVEPLRLAAWQFAVKRTIDILGTIVGGVLVLPVLAVAAVAVKASDRGPVLYRQTRIGRGGTPFTVLKFRTMRPNAADLYDQLAVTRAGRDGPLIKLVDDLATHQGRADPASGSASTSCRSCGTCCGGR